MIWIIEAGSSKTHSALIRVGHPIERIESIGLNPVTDPQFNSNLASLCSTVKDEGITEVYYYGSGCINQEVNNSVASIIKMNITEASIIHIADDLVGAGKSCYGNEIGIIGILGTGSNIGHYNGNTITDKISSCGYLLGDEGSGYRIGQAIYRRYARSQFTRPTLDLIRSSYSLRVDQAIAHLYKKTNPRTYLASFAKIIHEVPEEDQNEILNEVFDSFIRNMVLPMVKKRKHPVSLVGSIAFHFQDILREKFKKSNIIAGSFIKSPIEGLIKYHEHG